MAQLPNNDRQYVFETLRAKIADVFRSVVVSGMVPGATLARVHEFEEFPASEEERREWEEVPDPVVETDDPLMSVIVIGFPSVHENEYTSDVHTQLTIDWPISFDLGVVQSWVKASFPYPNSSRLFEAIFVRCADAFRNNRDLGYENVTHNYLQQTFAETIRDEDSGEPMSHSADWMLTTIVGGARM